MSASSRSCLSTAIPSPTRPENSIRVKRENIEDDQIGQYSVIAQAFGQQVAEFPDTLSFPLLVAGFTTLCFDGQNFFDTDHPMAGGTYSNIVGDIATDKGEPWFLIDESQVLKPILYQKRRAFNFRALMTSAANTPSRTMSSCMAWMAAATSVLGSGRPPAGPAHR